MKVLILYSSSLEVTESQPIAVPGTASPIYIRMEVVEAATLCKALDLATPREGETVLNTIHHPDEDPT